MATNRTDRKPPNMTYLYCVGSLSVSQYVYILKQVNIVLTGIMLVHGSG